MDIDSGQPSELAPKILHAMDVVLGSHDMLSSIFQFVGTAQKLRVCQFVSKAWREAIMNTASWVGVDSCYPDDTFLVRLVDYHGGSTRADRLLMQPFCSKLRQLRLGRLARIGESTVNYLGFLHTVDIRDITAQAAANLFIMAGSRLQDANIQIRLGQDLAPSHAPPKMPNLGKLNCNFLPAMFKWLFEGNLFPRLKWLDCGLGSPKIVATACPNLETFSAWYKDARLDASDVESLSAGCPKLSALHVFEIMEHDSLHAIARNLPNIQVLTISALGYETQGVCAIAKAATNLRDVSLLVNATDLMVAALVENCKQLSKLELHGPSITNQSAEALVLRGAHLTSLVLGWSTRISNLGLMRLARSDVVKSLTDLYIMQPLDASGAEAIARMLESCPHLSSLKLVSITPGNTDVIISTAAERCPELKVVEVGSVSIAPIEALLMNCPHLVELIFEPVCEHPQDALDLLHIKYPNCRIRSRSLYRPLQHELNSGIVPHPAA